jgi:hypothetical protein
VSTRASFSDRVWRTNGSELVAAGPAAAGAASTPPHGARRPPSNPTLSPGIASPTAQSPTLAPTRRCCDDPLNSASTCRSATPSALVPGGPPADRLLARQKSFRMPRTPSRRPYEHGRPAGGCASPLRSHPTADWWAVITRE